jgi:hypothetical protein
LFENEVEIAGFEPMKWFNGDTSVFQELLRFLDWICFYVDNTTDAGVNDSPRALEAGERRYVHRRAARAAATQTVDCLFFGVDSCA